MSEFIDKKKPDKLFSPAQSILIPANAHQYSDNRQIAAVQRKLQKMAHDHVQMGKSCLSNELVPCETENDTYQKQTGRQLAMQKMSIKKSAGDIVIDGKEGPPGECLSRQSINITSQIAQFRSMQLLQRAYAWSDAGEDGVIMDDNEPYVIKLGGYDGLAVSLDQLGAQFGFASANARIVREDDEEWPIVERAVDEAGGWSRDGTAEPRTEALLMNKVTGDELHETVGEIRAVEPASPTEVELGKIVRMCRDLGKMLVMDLLTRNNDRFNLVAFDNELLSTEAEKELGEDEWRPWMANEGNVLVNTATGAANPIDSQFTGVSDEPRYARSVAQLLTGRVDELVTSGMLILGDYNWFDQGYAKSAFKDGIIEGIDCLVSL